MYKPVRCAILNGFTHTSLPTRPHRWLVAGRDTHTSLPTRPHRWLVAGRDTHTSLPTRPHRWLVAGRDTHIHPCLQDRTDGWSPAETHIHPCLQDRTDGWSPAETHTYIPAYKTAQMAGRRQRHTHTSLPTRPHRWLVAGRDTQNRYECLSAGTVSMMYNYTSEAEGNCSRRLALKTGAAVCTSKVPGVSPVFGNP